MSIDKTELKKTKPSICIDDGAILYSINSSYIIFYCRIANIFGHDNGLIQALRNSFSSRHSDSGTKLASSVSAIPIEYVADETNKHKNQ